MPDGPSKREVRMFKVTIETEYQKCTVEVAGNNTLRPAALQAIQECLYGVGFRFDGILGIVEEA